MLLVLLATAPEPPALTSKEACTLANAAESPVGKTYSMPGTYTADWERGSFLEIPHCKVPFHAYLTGEAKVRRDAWHEAFRVRCGGTMMGDFIRGVFTGTFEKTKREFQGETYDTEVFKISRVATKDADPANIACPAK